jgi:hypothetical protein
MALPWQLFTERMVGRGHPTLSDTNNRALRELLSGSGYDPDSAIPPALTGPLFNVKAFGAVGDGVTDDTAAIQAAIDAANARAYRGIYVPALDPNNGYIFTQLKYYPGTRIVGEGIGGTFGGSRGTWLYQKSGTALEMVIPNDPTISTNKVVMEDIGFTAFQNQTNNTGGIRLEAASECNLVRVAVGNTNVYGVHFKGGLVGGDTMYNSLVKCKLSNLAASAKNFLLTSSSGSQPDGTSLIDCLVSGTTATLMYVDGAASRGCDTFRVIGCNFIGTNSTVALHQEGTAAAFLGNRFELIPSGTLTIDIVPVGGTSPSMFALNSYAAPGGLTFTDTQVGVRRSTRVGEMTTNGPLSMLPAPEVQINAITYSASMNPNHEAQVNTIVATNGTAFTINNGNNRRTGRRLLLDIKNSSGGALGAVTFGAAYLLAGAFVAPANTKRRLYEFYDDGTNLIETYRSGADI